jgi:hypothetical protein
MREPRGMVLVAVLALLPGFYGGNCYTGAASQAAGLLA